MADRELSRINDLRREASRAGLYKKAARIARQGAELATERRDHYWRVRFRFWEGESLQFTGDNEAATTALMEAARPEPEADPADIYNAITTLIKIAIADKPAAFTRRLIEQGREHLERSHKTAWRHMLELLEGDLAFERGHWTAALGHYRRAWECHSAMYPYYTTAAHLSRLVDTAFQLRDPEALAHWRRALDDCEKEGELDHLLAEQARLLCHRAGLTGLGDPVTAARGLLRRVEGFEGDQAEFAVDALRMLILHRHWPPVDDWLPRPGIGDDWLFGGDVHLVRARETLGLPPRDEEWCTTFERPNPATLTEAQRTQAREHLTAARTHYESKLDWAAKKDQRLETGWYTETLKERLQRAMELTP